jgi:hypothetical protein
MISHFHVVSAGLPEPGHIVLLTNVMFWSEQYDNLGTWCEEHHAEVKGMTVNIPSDEVLTLFCLRWT